ncbi:SDR family oxidoreductase [Anaerovorax odorimutans]|uniref:SDR family oxidoreductase n=1 Tax=Anaerovorax odorimutans TaxID=109327 RepID=A0ABT1RNQ2_9FIRM|nr:SDR family NAD(P)-dependent oxidoreductase [Anaerovorax odorimutans]MCQ4636820.1 SDR family oxidoreductase [Anaerovorax odorimutans]
MDLGINGKIAIVTGAGKGIGRACALALAAEGANVSLNDLDEEAGNAVAKDVKAMGVDAIFVKGDVSKECDVKELFAKTYEKYGHIDILINNAGISPKLPFYEITAEQFGQVLDVDLKSNFMCSKEAFAYMKDNGWGRIVSLSSLAGVYGGINSAAHYSAAKAGVIGLTKTLAKQVGKYNITVNCVAPGRIDTEMTRMLSQEKRDEALSRIPLKRFGSVEEVANTVVFLASEGGSYITGACVEILGGYTG